MVRPLQPANAPPDLKCREMLQPVTTKAFLQPAKAAAMCPPPPYPTIFASAKLMFKTNCAN